MRLRTNAILAISGLVEHPISLDHITGGVHHDRVHYAAVQLHCTSTHFRDVSAAFSTYSTGDWLTHGRERQLNSAMEQRSIHLFYLLGNELLAVLGVYRATD